jgi:hypothetical protein
MRVIRVKQGDTLRRTVTIGTDVTSATLESDLVAPSGATFPLTITVVDPIAGVVLIERQTTDLPEGNYLTDVRVTVGGFSFSTPTTGVAIIERVS